MRRTSAAVLAALALVLSVTTTSTLAGTAAAEEPQPTVGSTGAEEAALATLAEAQEVLSGENGAAGAAPDASARVSPTIALRDLFVALPDLSGEDKVVAEGMLARPTDRQDPNGDAYTVASKKTCSAKICIHWVPRSADAPRSRAWVDTTMKVMKKTWRREVGELGYRRPLNDGGRGGNKKFDVYLKDVGAQGYYGYCAPERSKPGAKWLASGYCVLDDDFARSQYGAKPKASLRVTAAHEFFHAIQFAYDYGEDRWLMEASATWVEERVADDVNDNRQYLRHGQVGQPADPLDLFNHSGFDQYGNWAFFEYLATRYGDDVVKRIWNRVSAGKNAPDDYSTQAVAKVLPDGVSWTDFFVGYAAGNTIPEKTYDEGAAWPSAPMAANHTLSAKERTAQRTVRIDHLAARHLSVKPADGLRARTWALTVTVDGPARKTRPAAYVLVHKKSGKVEHKRIGLDRRGDGRLTFRFTSRSVRRATVTLANASTRFNCWEQDTTYSCQGIPKDDRKRFGYSLELIER